MKKVAIPATPAKAQAAEAWIGGTSTEAPAPATPATPTEETKRLTIDLPKSLHKAFKALCAEQDSSMVTEINNYIAQRVAESKSGSG